MGRQKSSHNQETFYQNTAKNTRKRNPPKSKDLGGGGCETLSFVQIQCQRVGEGVRFEQDNGL